VTGSGFSRRLAGLGAALTVLLALVAVPLAGSASAEPDYPPKFNRISASSFTVARTGTITFRAQTFVAGSTVAFRSVVKGRTVTSGTASADAKGVVVQKIRFDVAGRNVVSFRGTSSKGTPLTLSVPIKVTDPTAANGGSSGTGTTGSGGSGGSGESSSSGGIPFIGALPHTGAQILGALLIGGALVGAGFLLVAASRRRRSRTA
jgi:LPXTG-motif cell wall-anchored protein